MICGRRVRVEMSTGRTRHDKDRYGGRGGGDRHGGGGYRGRSPSTRGGPPPRRGGEYRDSRRSGDDYRDDYRRKRYSRYDTITGVLSDNSFNELDFYLIFLFKSDYQLIYSHLHYWN